ncbi:MAG: SpoIVB peptidase S55 domain-containing protein [Lachnospiraceae bacterium]
MRDNTGTSVRLTFVDEKGNFGALGHGISDVDTGELLHISEGALYQAEIIGYTERQAAEVPASFPGSIRYERAAGD